MISHDHTRSCCSMYIIAIVRFVYIIVSTLGRLAGAIFSTLFSILLMAKTSDIFQATMCNTQGGTDGLHYFCGNGRALYYTFVGSGVLWATVLIWSFHRSAKHPNGIFARHNVFWIHVNLAGATVSMICGTMAVVMFGEELHAVDSASPPPPALSPPSPLESQKTQCLVNGYNRPNLLKTSTPSQGQEIVLDCGQ